MSQPKLPSGGQSQFRLRPVKVFPSICLPEFLEEVVNLLVGKLLQEPFILKLDAAFLLAVGSFLLTVELFYLQLTILAFLPTVGAFFRLQL